MTSAAAIDELATHIKG